MKYQTGRDVTVASMKIHKLNLREVIVCRV